MGWPNSKLMLVVRLHFDVPFRSHAQTASFPADVVGIRVRIRPRGALFNDYQLLILCSICGKWNQTKHTDRGKLTYREENLCSATWSTTNPP
jgi:hypothetical protein